MFNGRFKGKYTYPTVNYPDSLHYAVVRSGTQQSEGSSCQMKGAGVGDRRREAGLTALASASCRRAWARARVARGC